MHRLLAQEFRQVSADQLVADAAKAMKEGAADLEPDLSVLAHADLETLGPSATARGRKSVIAMQSALLQDCGSSGLTQSDIQALCVDGLNDLNMSDHLLMQSIKTRRRGMAKIYTATAGHPEESFCDFLAEIYGNYDVQSQSQSQSATPARPTKGTDAADSQSESEPAVPPSPAPSASSTADQEDLQAHIGDCKVVFPANPETLPTTGVPAEFISSRGEEGQYGCLYGDCDHKASSRPACATHIRRKHLGLAIGCKLCPAKLFYKHGSWQDHMRKNHPGLAPTEWYLDPNLGLPSDLAPGVSRDELASQLAAPAVQKVFAATPLSDPPATLDEDASHESEPAKPGEKRSRSEPSSSKSEPSPKKVKTEVVPVEDTQGEDTDDSVIIIS